MEDLIASVGFGKYSARQVLSRLFPPEEIENSLGDQEEIKISAKRAAARASGDGIVVDGVDHLLVRFANCCNPLPGDDVIGIITRGRGISVHANDCPNVEAERYDQDRIVQIRWDAKVKIPRTVKFKVSSEDKKGILAEMTSIISSKNINITHADIRTSADNVAINTFEVEVEDLDQLQILLKALSAVKGVISVDRIKTK